MNKSVLVMDTPRTCMRCPFGLISGDYFFCIITIDKDGAARQIRDDLYGVKKQDWCPLKPLPEKMTEVAQTDHWDSIKAGWNACINKITGKS
jgi:hypothetical protein